MIESIIYMREWSIASLYFKSIKKKKKKILMFNPWHLPFLKGKKEEEDFFSLS